MGQLVVSNSGGIGTIWVKDFVCGTTGRGHSVELRSVFYIHQGVMIKEDKIDNDRRVKLKLKIRYTN